MKKILTWLKNGRSTALPQSLTPAILAVAMSYGRPGFHLGLAILAVLGVACAHLALNLADDWFDYKVDMKGDRDKVIRKGFRAMTLKYPFLTDGSQTLRTTAYAIAQFVIVALACGCGILINRTGSAIWIMIGVVAACAVLGVFYSAPPLKLAYHGLGEPVIGVIFGPLIMIGVSTASCGAFCPDIAILSIPVGLLVLNILFTHSFIDLPADEEGNKMTFARLLGSNRANLVASAIFSFVPFVMVVAAVIAGIMHPLFLLVLLVLPRAIWLWWSLLKFSNGDSVDTKHPAKWLGAMQNWDALCAAGVDWFMIRWFTARNTLSGFCLIGTICSLVISIFNL